MSALHSLHNEIIHVIKGARMGLLGGLKNGFKKAEAAVVIQNVLDMQARQGIFPVKDSSGLANRLIAQVWDENPGLYDGTRHPRPHKATRAAKALVEGLVRESNLRIKAALFSASSTVLGELAIYGERYNLDEIDGRILEGLQKRQMQIGEALYKEINPD